MALRFELVNRPELSWTVFELNAQERLSKLSTVKLVAASPGLRAESLDDLLGEVAMASVIGSSGVDGGQGSLSWRRFHGLVTKVERRMVDAAHQGTLSVTVRPTASRLKSRRTSRIFQNQSAVEIVQRLCDEHRVELRRRLRGESRQREYTVQYRETDYAFVRRLLAEEGIFFFFDHPGAAAGANELDHTGFGEVDTMVVADYADAYPKLEPQPNLAFRPRLAGSALVDDDDQVNTFFPKRTKRFKSVAVRRYEFDNPAAVILGTADRVVTEVASRLGGAAQHAVDAVKAGAAVVGSVARHSKPRVGGHAMAPGTYYEHLQDYEEGDTDEDDTEVVVQQLRRRDFVATGSSHCPHLCAGFQFFLQGHPEADDGWWAVTSVTHHFGHSLERATSVESQPLYSNTFEVVPASVPYRPKAPKRLVQQTLETATVTGPGSDPIHTDRLGRIRIRFHWETDAESQYASCWIRVAQTWAGSGFGFQFIPRVGMEVVVGFLGGDVDRPMVVGCLPNAVNVPPGVLPVDRNVSRMRTRSTSSVGLATGYNELAFDDSLGGEKILLRAERDLEETIQHDRMVKVGNDRHQSVGGNDTTVVEGTQRTMVDGSQEVEIEGSVKLEANSGRATTIVGDDALSVAGRYSATIDSDATVTVDRNASIRVADNASVTVGAGPESQFALQVDGTLSAGSSEVLRLDSPAGVQITSGESTIHVTPDGILLDADTIIVNARQSVEVRGDGPTLSVAEEIEVVGKAIRFFAKDARLELGTDAVLSGERLLFNCDENEMNKDTESQDEELVPLQLRFTDVNNQPLAGKTFRLSAGGRTYRGELSAAGSLHEQILEGTTMAQVRVWLDEYPEGRTRDYSVGVEAEFAPPTTNEGAKQRLANLGYYQGEVDEQETGLFHPLRSFQEAFGLEVSGELDAATSDKLKQEVGH